ncbi:Uncharacterised protein [Raoultella terrigena]|uniref:Uncharacterized protein n=1 Tax=Raoultella terrigena TaxID=577 RepID=A0A4U9D8A0_RAOTE|nr:Uncharacterised protein [Raoultella terrigena]
MEHPVHQLAPRAKDPSAKGIDAINVSAAVNDPYFGMIRFSTAKAFPPVATNWGYFSTPETEKLATAVKHAFTPDEMNKRPASCTPRWWTRCRSCSSRTTWGHGPFRRRERRGCSRRAGLSISAW